MKLKNKIKKYLFNLMNVERVDKYIKSSIANKDFTEFEIDVIDKVSSFTMTSPERIVALIRATEYIENNNIKGAFVECGVWKGGSIMTVIHTLNSMNKSEKDIYLYDTYEGMTEPTDVDFSYKGNSAKKIYKDKQGDWCYSSLDEVKANISSIAYPSEKIFYIKGRVEETIPNNKVPEKIALLRLDTDWYESTLHEMKHLFPKLIKGGIIIIDDYGHWGGCKKAVDEYLDKNNILLFLSRVDYTCRIGVKL